MFYEGSSWVLFTIVVLTFNRYNAVRGHRTVVWVVLQTGPDFDNNLCYFPCAVNYGIERTTKTPIQSPLVSTIP